MGGIQQMQLDALGIARAVALRPGIEPRPLQGDRCGIEQIQQFLAFPAQLAAGLPHQQAGRLLKDHCPRRPLASASVERRTGPVPR